MVMDLHRRFGWGKQWLARRLNKRADELSEVDELKVAQRLTLAIGIAATAVSIFVDQIAEIFSIMVGVANTFGASTAGYFFARNADAADDRGSGADGYDLRRIIYAGPDRSQ